ncbi:MAG: LamG domain-containing protein, partial [Candidatus Omnitrophota bacterium]
MSWKFPYMNRRGSLMLMTLMSMLVLTVVAVAFLSSVINSDRVTAGQADARKAFYLAEAGVDQGIYYVLHNSSDGSWRTSSPITEYFDASDHSQGSYTLTVTGDTTITIAATGTFNDSTRSAQKQVTLNSGGGGVGAQVQLALDSASGGTTVDSSGNARNATVVGTPTFAAGKIGNAATVASGNYFNLGNILQASYNNISLSIWVKRNGVGGTETLVERGSRANSDGLGLMLLSGIATFGHADAYVAADTASIADNEWHLVTGVMEKNSSTYAYKIYVDGKLAGYSPGSSTGLSATTDAWCVGAHCGGTNPLTGSLDDAQIYTRALTAAEVKDQYEQGLGLRGWWKLDDGSGSFLLDSSIYSNNATSSGSPTWANGMINGGLTFASGKSAAATGSSSNAVSGAFTASAWIYPTASGIGYQSFLVQRSGCGSFNFQMYSSAAECANKLLVNIEAVSGSQYQVCTTAAVTLNQWALYTGVYDGTNLKIYKNGVLDNTANIGAVSIRGGAYNTNIGHDSCGSAFRGTLDDVRIYNTALTANEISRLYQDGMPSGLKGWWKFDDASGTSAVDSSIYAHTGTLTNPPTWTTGTKSGALSFSGTNQYVQVGNQSSLNITGALTLAAWINPAVLGSGYKTVVAKRTAGGATNYEVSLDTTTGAIIFYNGTIYLSSYIPPANKWTYIAVTVDGTSLLFYADGILVDSKTIVSLTTNAGSFAIGRPGDSAAQYFNGKIDDVRVYNRAISAAEDRAIYDDAALAGWWKFDEGSGTVAADSSGAGHAGTLVNTPSRVSGHLGSGALTLNGTTQYVSFSTSGLPVGDSPRTVSAWVKTTTTDEKYIVWWGGDNSNLNYAIGIYPGGQASFTQWGCALLSVSNVNNNQWHLITVTDAGNGSQQEMYIDGVWESSTTCTVSTSSGSTGYIGTAKGGDATYDFPGSIDDVRIYSRALSADDVLRVYQEGASSSVSGVSNVSGSWTVSTPVTSSLDTDAALTAFWKFEESSSTDGVAGVTDSSGNGHTGTWNGPPGVVAGKVYNRNIVYILDRVHRLHF